jgi:hypothetical protein
MILMPDRIWSRRWVTSLWLSWRRRADVRMGRRGQADREDGQQHHLQPGSHARAQ